MGVDRARRPRAARQPDLGRQLQPAAARRPGPRQRQDHPGARGRLPRRRLERDQGDLGLAAGIRCSPPTPTGALVKVMEDCVDGEYQTFKSRDGAYVREHFFGSDPRLLERVAHMSDEEIWLLNRGGHDQQKVYRRLPRGRRPHRPADGDPRQDDQGLRDGRLRRGPDDHPPGQEDDRGRAARLPRPLRAAAHRRAGPRRRVLQAARRHPGDAVPARAPRGARRSLPVRRRRRPSALAGARARAVPLPARGHRRARDLDDDGVRPRARRAAARQADRQATSSRSSPTSRARSAWRACSARSASTPRSASSTSRRTPSS